MGCQRDVRGRRGVITLPVSGPGPGPPPHRPSPTRGPACQEFKSATAHLRRPQTIVFAGEAPKRMDASPASGVHWDNVFDVGPMYPQRRACPLSCWSSRVGTASTYHSTVKSCYIANRELYPASSWLSAKAYHSCGRR